MIDRVNQDGVARGPQILGVTDSLTQMRRIDGNPNAIFPGTHNIKDALKYAFSDPEREAMQVLGRLITNSDVVRFTPRYNGIGDQIVMLRGVLAMARHMPNQLVQIQLGRLRELENLNLPPNATTDLTSAEPNATIHAFKGNFVIQYHDSPEVTHEVGLNLQSPATKVYKSKSRKLGGLSSYETANLLWAHLIGLDVPYEDMMEPIVTTNQGELPAQDIDLLLVPEAYYPPMPDKRHSVKSFSPEMWAKIFAEMKAKGFDGKLGIIDGHYWWNYVHDVYSMARQAGLNATSIYTNTLSDVVTAVLSARRYAGMDTGPTHLALDVVRMAQRAGREISLRQMSNGQAYQPHKFQLNFDGLSDAAVLLYEDVRGKGKRRRSLPGSDGRICDGMEDVDPKQVASFIME